MHRKDKPEEHWEQQTRRPEFRIPGDAMAEHGRQLRERLEALRPHSDLKHWR